MVVTMKQWNEQQTDLEKAENSWLEARKFIEELTFHHSIRGGNNPGECIHCGYGPARYSKDHAKDCSLARAEKWLDENPETIRFNR